MKLIIIRHGQTEDNKSDVLAGHLDGQLSDEGQKQVQNLGKYLKDVKIDFIYSSDVGRTKDTIKAILKFQPETPVIYDAQLREAHKGIFQGRTSKELKEEFQKSGSPWHIYRPKNGESEEDLRKRINKFLNEIISKHNLNDTILICTHSACIRELMAVFVKIPITTLGLYFFRFDNASISIFEIDEHGNRKIKCINCIDHLLNKYEI